MLTFCASPFRGSLGRCTMSETRSGFVVAAFCVLAILCRLSMPRARGADRPLAAPAPAAAEAAQPETTDGVKKLMEDIVAALQANDNDKAATLYKAMLLPDAEAWFTKTYGDEVGKK